MPAHKLIDIDDYKLEHYMMNGGSCNTLVAMWTAGSGCMGRVFPGDAFRQKAATCGMEE